MRLAHLKFVELMPYSLSEGYTVLINGDTFNYELHLKAGRSAGIAYLTGNKEQASLLIPSE